MTYHGYMANNGQAALILHNKTTVVVTSAGLEPATYRLGICRSILMSYEATTSILYAQRWFGYNRSTSSSPR